MPFLSLCMMEAFAVTIEAIDSFHVQCPSEWIFTKTYFTYKKKEHKESRVRFTSKTSELVNRTIFYRLIQQNVSFKMRSICCHVVEIAQFANKMVRLFEMRPFISLSEGDFNTIVIIIRNKYLASHYSFSRRKMVDVMRHTSQYHLRHCLTTCFVPCATNERIVDVFPLSMEMKHDW